MQYLLGKTQGSNQEKTFRAIKGLNEQSVTDSYQWSNIFDHLKNGKIQQKKCAIF